MVGRSMIVDGTLEDDYLKPLPFISVPIMRAKGGKDNTSERVVGGKLKFCLTSLASDGDDEETTRTPRRSSPRKKPNR
jgi:hypothetical protein